MVRQSTPHELLVVGVGAAVQRAARVARADARARAHVAARAVARHGPRRGVRRRHGARACVHCSRVHCWDNNGIARSMCRGRLATKVFKLMRIVHSGRK